MSTYGGYVTPMSHRSQRKMPMTYNDPDVEDASYLTIAAYALQLAGREKEALACALEAAETMKRFPLDKNGDHKVGPVVYSHHGILTTSFFGNQVQIPAPPFDADGKAAGHRQKTIELRELKSACRVLGYGWFPTLQMREMATGRTMRPDIRPSLALRRLLPVLAAYDPTLPQPAAQVLREKMLDILANSKIRNMNAGPWYYIMQNVKPDVLPFTSRKRFTPNGKPWPGDPDATFCRFGWFEKDQLKEAYLSARSLADADYSPTLWKEATGPAPHDVCWIPALVSPADQPYQDALATIENAANDHVQARFASWIVADAVDAAERTCDLIRLDAVLKNTGSEYVDGLLRDAKTIGPIPDMPEHPCIAAGMLACSSSRHRKDGHVDEELYRTCKKAIHDMLTAFDADGSLSIELEDPDEKQENKS